MELYDAIPKKVTTTGRDLMPRAKLVQGQKNAPRPRSTPRPTIFGENPVKRLGVDPKTPRSGIDSRIKPSNMKGAIKNISKAGLKSVLGAAARYGNPAGQLATALGVGVEAGNAYNDYVERTSGTSPGVNIYERYNDTSNELGQMQFNREDIPQERVDAINKQFEPVIKKAPIEDEEEDERNIIKIQDDKGGTGTVDFGTEKLNDKYKSKINNSKGTLNTINLDNHGQFQLGERIKSIGARQRAGEISVAQAQEEMRMAKAAFTNLGQPESQGYQESSFPDPRQNLLATILSTKGGERRAAIKAYELANKQFGDLAQRGADSSKSQNQLGAAESINKQRSKFEKQKLAQQAGFSNKEYGLKERQSDRADEELGLKVKDNYFENLATQLQDANPEERVQLIDAMLLDREADEY